MDCDKLYIFSYHDRLIMSLTPTDMSTNISFSPVIKQFSIINYARKTYEVLVFGLETT